MEKIYIYSIYFPTNNKYYIGQTNNMRTRMYAHLRSGSLVCKALLKVNSWHVAILRTCKSRDEANKIEIEEIRNHNSVAPNGYNLHVEGCSFTDETKEKMRFAHLNKEHSVETKDKISNSRKGQVPSFESREKMRQSHLGTKCSENKKRNLQIGQLKRRIREFEDALS